MALSPASFPILTLAIAFSIAASPTIAAKTDDLEAPELYQKAIHRLYGTHGESKSRSQAIQLLNRAAESDFAPAYNLLGFLYLEGNRFFTSQKKALRMFERSAALNDAPGQFNAGYSYLIGRGVEIDLNKAAAYLRAIVEPKAPHQIAPEDFELYKQTKASAYYYLGLLSADPLFESENHPQAIELISKSEQLGKAAAAMYLAIEYALGTNIEQNAAQADQYLDRFDLLTQNEIRLAVSKVYFEGMDKDLDGLMRDVSDDFQDDIDEHISSLQTSIGISLLVDRENPNPQQAARWLERSVDKRTTTRHASVWRPYYTKAWALRKTTLGPAPISNAHLNHSLSQNTT